jgi:protein-tyrosine phosphatase
MRKAAAGRGYAIDGTARGFDPADFERFDWIVTMDEDNFADISALAPSEEAARKVRSIREWIDLPDVREVPDPYYGGARGFDRVLDILEAGCGNLLEWLVLRHGIAADTP